MAACIICTLLNYLHQVLRLKNVALLNNNKANSIDRIFLLLYQKDFIITFRQKFCNEGAFFYKGF